MYTAIMFAWLSYIDLEAIRSIQQIIAEIAPTEPRVARVLEIELWEHALEEIVNDTGTYGASVAYEALQTRRTHFYRSIACPCEEDLYEPARKPPAPPCICP